MRYDLEQIESANLKSLKKSFRQSVNVKKGLYVWVSVTFEESVSLS